MYEILEAKLEVCASVPVLPQPEPEFSALGVPSVSHGSS